MTEEKLSHVEKLARDIRAYFIIFGCGCIMVTLAYAFIDHPYDDTDGDGVRSGFVLMTDHGTGCQYLKSGKTLTPRLDVDGAPLCGDK